MLSYYIRRASSHAFNTAVRHNPMQSSTDIAGNLSYLFGLDWHVASEYKDISDKETLRRKLKQAAKDPVSDESSVMLLSLDLRLLLHSNESTT